MSAEPSGERERELLTFGDQVNELNTLRAYFPPANPTKTFANFNTAVVTSFLPGLRDRSKYGAYCVETRAFKSSELDEVNGSVDASRTSEVRHERAAAERGELFDLLASGMKVPGTYLT